MTLSTMPPPQPPHDVRPDPEQDNSPPTPRRRSAVARWKLGRGRTALAAALWVAAAVVLSGVAARLAGRTAGWAALAVALSAGIALAWRTRRKRRGEDTPPVLDRRRERPKSAFRGLFPFEAGERLPGQDRATVARYYAEWLMDGDPAYRLMCADSGCGKTSLVRTELWARLDEGGWAVRYFDGRSEGRGDPWLAAVEEMETLPGDGRTVFVLDQFEKFFAAEPRVDARKALGARLGAALRANAGLRVLCIVPATHMLDMDDLRPGLDDPTSGRSLLPLRHFSTMEAREVILECARRDGLEVPPELARSLAEELSEDGRVRPTELQIVCTFLGRSFTEERYRKAGGAAGILAQHVRRALAKAEPPELGARVLRAMCDFGEFTRGEALTVGELATQVAGKASSESREAVRRILAQFIDARIVRRAEGDAEKYELVHDYLVQPVNAATNNAATRRETANQQLKYHLRSGDRTVPFRRALFIGKHADAALRSSLRARRLLWTSLLLPPAEWTVAAAVLAFSLGAAFAVLEPPTWREETVGAQPIARNGFISAHSFTRPRRIVSADGSGPTTVIRDSSGGTVRTIPGGLLTSNASGRWLIIQRPQPNGRPTDPLLLVAFDAVTGREYPIPAASADHATFANDSVLTYLDWRADSAGAGHRDLVAYLLPRNVELGRIHNVSGGVSDALDSLSGGVGTGQGMFVSASLTRIAVPLAENGITYPVLYDLSSGQPVAALRDASHEADVLFTFDPQRQAIVTVAKGSNGGITLRRWSFDSGAPLPEQVGVPAAAAAALGQLQSIDVGAAGSEVLVAGRSHGLLVRRDADPEPVRMQARSSQPSTRLPAWSGAGMTTFLDIANGHDESVIRTAAEPRDFVSPSAAGGRVIVQRRPGEVELWAPRAAGRIAVLHVPGTATDALWSADSAAVLVIQKHNLVSAFDAETGEPLGHSFAKPQQLVTSTYSRACRRLTIWYSDGNVIRWTRGRWILGHFWPSSRCKG